jgi:hypothetical protein
VDRRCMMRFSRYFPRTFFIWPIFP